MQALSQMVEKFDHLGET